MDWLTKLLTAEPSVLVGIYAAIVSTMLGVLRLFEFFLDRRPKIIALASLTGLPELGNTVTLVNKSKSPAFLYYYELVWAKPGLIQRLSPYFLKRVVSTESPITHEHADITIGAHAKYMI
jgi:hypothetical protein